LYLTGPSHDHLGYLSGGWTIRWQGYEDRYYGTGQTFFDAMSARIENETGTLEDTWEDSDTVVVIFTEPPYTEGVGDTNVPSLFQGLAHPDNQAAYNEALAAKEAEKTKAAVAKASAAESAARASSSGGGGSVVATQGAHVAGTEASFSAVEEAAAAAALEAYEKAQEEETEMDEERLAVRETVGV
jgi:hypothetical protein